MSNEDGYSWSEAILTLLIFTIVFSTLVPVTVHLQQQLYSKKIDRIASELLAQSAIRYRAYGETFGRSYREETFFNWEFSNDQICVTYLREELEHELCTD